MFCRHTASAPIKIIVTENFLDTKIQKWSILTFFLAMTVTGPDPAHSGPLGGFLQTACACDFREVTFQVDLTSWLDKLSLVKWFEERPEAMVTNQLDKRNLSSWFVKFHLCPKHKCRTLKKRTSSIVLLEKVKQAGVTPKKNKESTFTKKESIWYRQPHVPVQPGLLNLGTGWQYQSHGACTVPHWGNWTPYHVPPCTTLNIPSVAVQ